MSEAETTLFTPEPELQETIQGLVADHGCAVTHIPDPAVPDRIYSASVGFEANVQQPEVLIYGLERPLAESMINEVFRQCKEDGLDLQDGTKLGNLIEGFDCMARHIEDPRARFIHLAYANWYQTTRHDAPITRAVQIVWPDPKTRAFPWDAECSDQVRNWQTPLYPAGAPA